MVAAGAVVDRRIAVVAIAGVVFGIVCPCQCAVVDHEAGGTHYLFGCHDWRTCPDGYGYGVGSPRVHHHLASVGVGECKLRIKNAVVEAVDEHLAQAHAECMCEGNEKIVGDGTRRPYALEGNGYGLSLGLAYDNGNAPGTVFFGKHQHVGSGLDVVAGYSQHDKADSIVHSRALLRLRRLLFRFRDTAMHRRCTRL